MHGTPDERPALHGAALDAEIRRVELALIDRETRFVDDARQLGDRIHAAIPKSLGGGAAAGGAAAIALGIAGWLFRPRSHAAPSASGGSAPAPGSTTKWGRYLSLLWPMVPREWKARIDPRMLTLATAVGLPLLERLVARRQRPPRTEPYVDLHRYAGRWYEVARLPESHEQDCAGDITADYIPLDARRFTVVNSCLQRDGTPKVAEGIAEIVRGGHGARLRVNFADAWLRKLGFAWADYWILRVDRDYDTALVGTPDRKHLWVLSRTPGIEPEMYRRMIDYARIEGYDVDRVLVTRQSDETPSPRSRRAARARQRDAATA